MSDIAKLIGGRIRNLRKEKGWSQEELAHRANIGASYMGAIERGEISTTVDSLEKIACAFEITFEDLFRHLQPSTAENKGNTTLALLLNKLNKMNVDNQKFVLEFVDLLLDKRIVNKNEPKR